FLEQGEGYCEHCKRSDYEVAVYQHHWAPKQLFEDWKKWPTSNLCFDCIVEWHSVMRNKRKIIDQQIVAVAEEQCGIEVETEDEDYYPIKHNMLDAWLIAIEAELEERL